MKLTLNTLGAITTAIIIIGAGFGVYNYFNQPEADTSGIPTLEERCDFVVKSSDGKSLQIAEPHAGTFKYELYATPDGFVEVWKCNK